MKPLEKPYKIRVDIRAEKGSEELLPEGIYDILPSRGIWIEEKGDDVIIKAYPSDVEEFVDYLRKSNISVKDVNVEKEVSLDYAELTKKYFRPIRIEDVTILAPWHKKRKSEKCIVIEPGMAFGTGRHESTKLMLKLMRHIDMEDKSVLDIGCGSGILSLYANVLGAKTIIAVDNDMDAILSVKKNLTLNDANRIETACTDLHRIKGTYDIILANLDIQTFTRRAGYIKKLLKSGGFIVISGVLVKNKKDVLPLFHPLSLIRTEKKNSWCGFVFK
ncbi:MAG: 50S ribosomal protein L11 methyltransferase [Proteobacteria bacterium]|nr:50S ribosomal protein L11 methyltransferase [Pseudomonadota bacterium]